MSNYFFCSEHNNHYNSACFLCVAGSLRDCEAKAPSTKQKFSRSWETINSTLYRLKVFGGWVVEIVGTSITFVPDPNHEWELE